eukprot:1364020-Amorphochlora_amoeboformis.AAC.1
MPTPHETHPEPVDCRFHRSALHLLGRPSENQLEVGVHSNLLGYDCQLVVLERERHELKVDLCVFYDCCARLETVFLRLFFLLLAPAFKVRDESPAAAPAVEVAPLANSDGSAICAKTREGYNADYGLEDLICIVGELLYPSHAGRGEIIRDGVGRNV